MKITTKNLRAFTVGACLAIVSASTFATGWPVFDISNFIKNTITSTQSVKAYAQQTSQYMTQLLQYKQQLVDAMQLPGQVIGQATAPITATYGQIMEAKNAMQNVYGTADQLQQMYQFRMRDMTAYGGDWKSYIQHEVAMSGQNDANIQAAFQRELQTTDRLASQINDANAAAAKVPEMQGHMQALQGMNIALQQLRAGQADLTQQIVYANMLQHDKDMREEAAHKLSADSATKFSQSEDQLMSDAEKAKGARSQSSFGTLK